MTGLIAQNDNDPRYQEGFQTGTACAAMMRDSQIVKASAWGPPSGNTESPFDKGWMGAISKMKKSRRI
jgi:hypothetical protein